jgi:hypothetical protein
MPSALKILGQSELSTSSFGTTLYTVPTSVNFDMGGGDRFYTLVTSIVLCNRNASSNDYSIRVVPKSATAGVEHIIFNGITLTTDATDIISLGLTVSSGDKIEASSSLASLSASVFGVETH